MPLMIALDELKKLPVEERLEWVTALWDSIPEKDLPEESPEFIAEIMRREQELKANPASGVLWEGVESRILKRRG